MLDFDRRGLHRKHGFSKTSQFAQVRFYIPPRKARELLRIARARWKTCCRSTAPSPRERFSGAPCARSAALPPRRPRRSGSPCFRGGLSSLHRMRARLDTTTVLKESLRPGSLHASRWPIALAQVLHLPSSKPVTRARTGTRTRGDGVGADTGAGANHSEVTSGTTRTELSKASGDGVAAERGDPREALSPANPPHVDHRARYHGVNGAPQKVSREQRDKPNTPAVRQQVLSREGARIRIHKYRNRCS